MESLLKKAVKQVTYFSGTVLVLLTSLFVAKQAGYTSKLDTILSGFGTSIAAADDVTGSTSGSDGSTSGSDSGSSGDSGDGGSSGGSCSGGSCSGGGGE